MNSILYHIKQESLKNYGKICDNTDCGMHEAFCRCHKDEERRNKRIDIIGRNGNLGLHYEKDN